LARARCAERIAQVLALANVPGPREGEAGVHKPIPTSEWHSWEGWADGAQEEIRKMFPDDNRTFWEYRRVGNAITGTWERQPILPSPAAPPVGHEPAAAEAVSEHPMADTIRKFGVRIVSPDASTEADAAKLAEAVRLAKDAREEYGKVTWHDPGSADMVRKFLNLADHLSAASAPSGVGAGEGKAGGSL
jgi:hypothetical protein